MTDDPLQRPLLGGAVPALVTPLDDDGTVDEAALRALVAFLAGAGVHGLHPCGTTGEAPLLSSEERRQVLSTVLAANETELPVIAQVGHMHAAEAASLARHAVAEGASAISVVTPYYYALPKEALFDYFLEVVAAVPGDFPVYLYNIPQNTGNAVSSRLLRRVMRAAPNVRGLKHSQPDVDVLASYLALDEAPEIWVGSDGHALAGLALGAVGVVSGNANAAPELVVALFDAVRRGELDRARSLQHELSAIAALLGSGGDLAATKAAVAERGVPLTPRVKPPLRPLTPDAQANAARAAQRAAAFAS